MKKITAIIIAVTAALLCAAFLASCTSTLPEEGKGHEWGPFEYGPKIGEKIYLLSSCSHCGDTRGYSAAPSKGFDYSENPDGSVCISGIGSCRDEFLIIPKYNEFGKEITGVSDEAFNGNEKIRYVSFESVRKIGSYAFVACKNLCSVYLPENLCEIGEFAFYEAENLLSVNIPEGITEIKAQTFSGCKALREVAIPSNVTKIGRSAFARCHTIKKIELPLSVEIIGEYCFDDCISLTEVSLGQIKDIPEGAFSACIALENPALSDKIESIGSLAFIGCTSLRAIFIPKSVKSLTVRDGASPFYLCTREDFTVYCEEDGKKDSWDEDFDVTDFDEKQTGDDVKIRAKVLYSVTREEFEKETSK